MKILIVACFLVLGGAAAAPRNDLPVNRAAGIIRYAANNFKILSPRQKIETINEFMDMVFTELGFLIVRMDMDPMALPDVQQGVAGGTLTMKNGTFADLSKIYRDGDVILIYENRILTATVPMKFPHFKLDYDYSLGFWGLVSNGLLKGNVEDVVLHFTVETNFKELVLTLIDFTIPDIQKLDVEFEGGVIGSIANAVSKLVTSLFKTTIKNTLESVIKTTLETVLEQVNEVLAGIKNPQPIYVLPKQDTQPIYVLPQQNPQPIYVLPQQYWSPRQKIETINEFMDIAFAELGFLIVRKDIYPIALPDFKHGTLTMKNGTFVDLPQIFRDGDVILIYENRILTATVPIEFLHFRLDYDYSFKFLGLVSNGLLKGNIEGVVLHFTVEMNFKELVLTLKDFTIPYIQKLDVKFEEGGVIGAFMNAVFKLQSSTKNKNTLEGVMKNNLEDVLEQVNKVLAGIKNPQPIYVLPHRHAAPKT